MPQKFYTKGGKVRPITPRINFTYRGHRNFLPLDENGKAIVASRGILQTAHDPSTKREDKLKLKRALVSASNKALALGKNAPFGSAERAKYSDVANVYRDAYEAIRIVDIKPTKLQRGYEVSGTSLQGYLEGVTYDQLKAKYGKPDNNGQWLLKMPNQEHECITIYPADEDQKHLDRVTKWHVGGWNEHNEKVLSTVRKDTRDFKGAKVKDAKARFKKTKSSKSPKVFGDEYNKITVTGKTVNINNPMHNWSQTFDTEKEALAFAKKRDKRLKQNLKHNRELTNTEDPFEGDDDPYGIEQEGMSDSERFGTGFSVGDEVPLSRKR